MRNPDCDAFQQTVFEAGGDAAVLRDRPDLAAHHAGCADCQRWLEAFSRGLDEAGRIVDLTAGVMARTGRAACGRARELTAAAADAPLTAIEQALVDAHLEACAECRAIVTEMAVVSALLPALGVVDPGPTFTARVLAATSRRPAPARWAAHWRNAWAGLVGRPRFAWEAAYVATLCWVLVLGNPLGAWEWTAARVEPLVEQVGAPSGALGVFDARVQALRERVSGGAADSTSGVTGNLGATWAAWASRTWNALVKSVSDGLARIVAALESAAAWIRQWALDLLASVRPAVTEPGDDGVRSRQ